MLASATWSRRGSSPSSAAAGPRRGLETYVDASGGGGDATNSAPAQTFSGWFIGSGVEYALGFWPGLFWKTEYRFADYRSRDNAAVCVTGSCGDPGAINAVTRINPSVQTVRSELVWRFNWAER